jgi:hypothetical protein
MKFLQVRPLGDYKTSLSNWTFGQLLCCTWPCGLTTYKWRKREARVPLRQAPGLPAIAGRGVVGAPGSSRLLPIRPAPPDVTCLPR